MYEVTLCFAVRVLFSLVTELFSEFKTNVYARIKAGVGKGDAVPSFNVNFHPLVIMETFIIFQLLYKLHNLI